MLITLRSSVQAGLGPFYTIICSNLELSSGLEHICYMGKEKVNYRRARYPYDGYLLSKPFFHAKEGRYMVLLIRESDKHKTTTSYARYLYSVAHKTLLSKELHVDHIDEDRTNDTIGNLQVLSHQSNVSKMNKLRKSSREIVELKCPWCQALFHREKRQTFLSKGGVFTACSRKCSGEVRSFLQNKSNRPEEKVNEVLSRISENFIRVVQEGHQPGVACSGIEASHRQEDYAAFSDPL